MCFLVMPDIMQGFRLIRNPKFGKIKNLRSARKLLDMNLQISSRSIYGGFRCVFYRQFRKFCSAAILNLMQPSCAKKSGFLLLPYFRCTVTYR